MTLPWPGPETFAGFAFAESSAAKMGGTTGALRNRLAQYLNGTAPSTGFDPALAPRTVASAASPAGVESMPIAAAWRGATW
jgi:hypothetical protein